MVADNKTRLLRNLLHVTPEKKEAIKKKIQENKEKREKGEKTGKIIKRRKRVPTEKRKNKNLPPERQYEMTMHLAPRVKRECKKFKASRAIRDIKRWVRRTTNTSEIRIDPSVNEAVWSKGVGKPPRRLRLILTRKVNEEKTTEQRKRYYVLVSYKPVDSFKGLQNQWFDPNEAVQEE